jgi:chromosome partitioning protein
VARVVNAFDVSRETAATLQRLMVVLTQPWRLLDGLHEGPPVSLTPASAGVPISAAAGPGTTTSMASAPSKEGGASGKKARRGTATKAAKAPVRRPSDPPRVMAVANQKGGVGKTTTAVNLGAALAEMGLRTLVVDLDPQGNASTGLGLNVAEVEVSMYDVVTQEAPIEDCVEATSVRNLFVAPASLDLAGAEIELVSAMSRELRLRQALEDVGDDYDYVLIDCPPSLGLLTLNGLAAASEVCVPIQCEYYALEGLGQLLRNVDLVKRNLNPSLEVSTIVLVMYDGRTTLAREVAADVRSHFGDRVCKTVVPRTVRLSEAPSYGQPITTFDPRSTGAKAYRSLAQEVADGAP